MTTEHRPDAADDLVVEIMGAARPVVDKAIDAAALLALDGALGMADELRDNFPGVPANHSDGAFHGIDSQAYVAGWDDGLAELVRRVRAARHRIQQYHDDKEAANATT